MPNIETGISGSLITIATKARPARLHDRLQTGTATTLTLDVAALERDLRAGMRGEVRFSAGDRERLQPRPLKRLIRRHTRS